MTKLQRFLLLYGIFNLCLLFCACGDWTSQASGIIGLVIPAVQSAVAILAAFGIGISPSAMAAVQAWGNDAQDALTNIISPAIAAYNAASADAKATLLTKIDAALNSILSNLGKVLTDVHVTNPQTQAKITAIFGMISAWLLALMNLIPAIQGKVSHAEAKKLVAAVKTTDEFKRDFNQVAGSFGKEYVI